MALIRSVTVGDRIIDLNKFTGEVMEEKKWATTHVSSSGGGYNAGTGQHNPVTISSVSQTHDQFFLKDDSGQEKAVNLTNAAVALRKGHRVTVLSGALQGQQFGPYLAIVNHTTGDVTRFEQAIQGLVTIPRPALAPLAWIASIFGICFYGLGIIGIVALVIAGKKRKRRNDELIGMFRPAVEGAIAEAKTA